jgi:methylisocitrate lyase
MKPDQQTNASRLRKLLGTRTIGIPGAFNALIAMQIERAGYETVYVSGAALSACRGVPDIGLLTLADVADEAGRIARSVSIPTIVDADTGYGGPSAVREAVRAFEEVGLAGMQIEDQEPAKKCGHLAGKRLIPIGEMASKIEAAVLAKTDRDFMIIARTDARAVEGIEGAVRRAKAYADAGADALFPEALESADEFQRFARDIRETGVTGPLVAELKLFGTQRDWLHHMMTRKELYKLLRYPESLDSQAEDVWVRQ